MCVKIASECIEPKEYYVGPFKVQRTDIDMYLNDFEKAIKTGEPTSKFSVTKYDYFYDLENEYLYKICYHLEATNDSDQYIAISKDSNPSQTEFYHAWGKAKMGESTKGCECYTKAGKIRECTEDDEYPPVEPEPEENPDEEETPDND